MRLKLKQRLNDINSRYIETRIAMVKLNASKEQLEKLRMVRRELEKQAYSEYSDGLQRFNKTGTLTIQKGN